ncbi:HNH endonuclease family protein [Amycolatopsis orientalis]|uniref:HNH endonuclease family protein n=1 Tax=Amycolatopsis orientalis TaxID=31958 RepID=UPI0003F5D2DE|nr:HNH endonuclease family protein [Amycolatopsis orientalis]
MIARTIGTLAIAATVAATPAGCQHPRTPAGTTSPPAAARDGGTVRIDPGAVRATLAGLKVAVEDTGNVYRRAEWPHWETVSGACDAREHTLKTQGTAVTTGPGCTVTGGRWVSPYDGITVTDAKYLDVDHVVPLAEAARSGTRGWSRTDRQRYANDPRVLIAVTAKSNRSKGDSDPAKWLPGRDKCGYLARWVETKRAYRMTVDQAEHDAIDSGLRRC